jgi:hypothetical protein
MKIFDRAIYDSKPMFLATLPLIFALWLPLRIYDTLRFNKRKR